MGDNMVSSLSRQTSKHMQSH